MISDDLEDVLLSPPAKETTDRLATVTSTSPLRVKLDGSIELPATPLSLVSTLAVDDRVLVRFMGRQLVIIGGGLATKSYVDSGIPTGVIQMWPGAVDEIPAAWLRCIGGEVSRTGEADLFAAIGTTYGDGDGSTTFNLPDFTYASPVGAYGTTDFAPGASGGASNHQHTTPNHNHGLSTGWARWATDRSNDWAAWGVKAGITQWTGSYRTGSGALTDTTTSTTYTEGLSLGGNTESDGAGNTGSGDSYHPYLAVSFIIKR